MKGVFVTYVGARVARSDESTSLPQHMWVEFVVGSTPVSPLLNNQYFQIPTQPAMIVEEPLCGCAA